MRRFAIVPALLLPLLISGCVIIPGLRMGPQPLEEVVLVESDRVFTTSRILLLDVAGTISSDPRDDFFGGGTSLVEDIHESLEMAREDSNIKALIVRINSPGGGVTPSEIVHHEIRRFAEETGIPVIAMLMDMAASGGYYIASAADRIVATPTTVTGSIGVILMTFNVEGLEDLIGVEVAAFTSGEHKDILSPFRTMTDSERVIVQSIIDDMYGRFVDVVVTGRNREGHGLSRDRVEDLADGRIYTASQALEAGLVDDIAHLPEMVDGLKEELNLRDVRVITYRRGGRAAQSIYSQAPATLQNPLVDVDLIDTSAIVPDLSPGFYYLWLPGR